MFFILHVNLFLLLFSLDFVKIKILNFLQNLPSINAFMRLLISFFFSLNISLYVVQRCFHFFYLCMSK